MGAGGGGQAENNPRGGQKSHRGQIIKGPCSIERVLVLTLREMGSHFRV